MKTLIIQLARLGDIYQSWPVARALKRLQGGEVHYLVRPRFQAALNGIGCVDKVWALPTEGLVAPLLADDFDLDSSMACLDEFYENIQAEQYDQIINLSFSPASSFLVSAITTQNTAVAGYSRHADGYLNLNDDVSRYFWAQVGVGFPNRLHLVDLFGGLAGVDYAIEDFREPDVALTPTVEGDYFVLHIGASEGHKRATSAQWKSIIQNFADKKMQWVLVGSLEEQQIAQEIASTDSRIKNFVGKTKIEDLFGLIKFSKGVIGGDSVAMHMAPFVDQKAFCISSKDVKFWETGPITMGSVVSLVDKMEQLNTSETAAQIFEWHKGNTQGLITVAGEGPRYRLATQENASDLFAWNLVQAVYMSAPYPMTSDINFYRGCLRLFEANSVAQQNLRKRHHIQKDFMTSILDRVDEIFMAVVGQVPSLMPLFRWYQAEKTRIQPGTFDQIAQDTEVIHQVFGGLLKKYLLEEDIRKVEKDGNL